MFYVSGINGTLTPFEPFATPIATTIAPVQPLQPVSSSTAAVPSDFVDTAHASSSELKSQDASILEGSVVPTTRDLIGGANALNVGRAGATVAYQIQEALPTESAEISHDVRRIDSVENTEASQGGSSDQPKRVNPIRKRYGSQTPGKERKPVVVAGDIMSSPVFTLEEHSPIQVAQSVFQRHKYRHIPIVNTNGRLVGIISDRDFFGTQSSDINTQIKDRMVTDILTARPEAPIRLVAETLISHRIGCLPIVNEAAKLVGIITRSDILRAIVNHAPIELWT